MHQFAVDPLYAHGVTLAVVIIALARVLIAFAALMGSVTLMIWLNES